MITIISFWLPIGAFIISIVSITISLSNTIFNRRFESAKKRTELVSELLKSKSFLESKREELFKVKTICADCSASQGNELCEKYDELIENINKTCKAIDKLKSNPNPIKFQRILTKQLLTQQNIASLVKGIDNFILNSKLCASNKN